ncbi:MAG: TdeIII family type II restriction endonuclease [Deltaproteobacteria bacterium]|nr:MAG: TdeIII family type II restriction endonuclease [Deltaproteobacteria bacterium]
MGLSASKKEQVQNVIVESIRTKLERYNPETKYMPFHHHLLGKDRMALFSFIQSLNTTFGTSIYEPVAIALADGRFKHASSQVKPYKFISKDVQFQIQEIMDDLTAGAVQVNKLQETEDLRQVCQTGEFKSVKLTKVDIWLETFDGTLYLIDMKTVKPNKGAFQKFKRTLLEWTGAELARNPHAQINTLIGIPYNPYYPKRYERWAMDGMLDRNHEVKVAEELWDFVGGKGTYNDLLDCFEQAGIELRSELDKYFQRFA